MNSNILNIANTETTTGDVTAVFLGVSTLLFSDGDTTLLIDGFFSRPPLWKIILKRKLTPDVGKIEQLLKRFHIDKGDLSAVLVAHSHYDHAMDSGVVAGLRQATVFGSESTKRIVIGSNVLLEDSDKVKSENICVVSPGMQYRIGNFIVTFYESTHFDIKFFGNKLNGTPVDPNFTVPAKYTEYAEGSTYSIHIQHPQGSAIVHPSANYTENALNNVRADVAFLGVSTFLGIDAGKLTFYWHEVVGRSNAKRIFPIHWDRPSGSLNENMRTLPLLLDDVTTTIRTLRALTETHGGTMELLPFNKPVSIFRDLAIQKLNGPPGEDCFNHTSSGQ